MPQVRATPSIHSQGDGCAADGGSGVRGPNARPVAQDALASRGGEGGGGPSRKRRAAGVPGGRSNRCRVKKNVQQPQQQLYQQQLQRHRGPFEAQKERAHDQPQQPHQQRQQQQPQQNDHQFQHHQPFATRSLPPDAHMHPVSTQPVYMYAAAPLSFSSMTSTPRLGHLPMHQMMMPQLASYAMQPQMTAPPPYGPGITMPGAGTSTMHVTPTAAPTVPQNPSMTVPSASAFPYAMLPQPMRSTNVGPITTTTAALPPSTTTISGPAL